MIPCSWRQCVTAALLAVVWLSGRPARSSPRAVETAAQTPLAQAGEACIACHRDTVLRYRASAKGNASGAAAGALLKGSFDHAESGVHYRVFLRDGAAWMDYTRAPQSGKVGLQGERRLEYFVGSGKLGRTYLYEAEGAWFELPINWYTPRKEWLMAPAFEHAPLLPQPLPVEPNCLHCHATRVEAPLDGTQNRFAERPFDEAGIGCSACHGDGARHSASGGHAAIANPATMRPQAQRSVCLQCHLEADATVFHANRSLADFRPGMDVGEVASYFVRASAEGGGQRAASQYEALLRSGCMRGTRGTMTCVACHDPHGEPAPAQRVAFYRQKCLACHTSPTFAVAQHFPKQQDCAACHMPARKTLDVSHEQVTDHSIPRIAAKAATERPPWKDGEQLVTVGNVPAGDREWGLAYAQRAQQGDRKAAALALRLLQRAAASGADDAALHTSLGWLYQVSGDRAAATREYNLVLQLDPQSSTATANVAADAASRGEWDEAVRLLSRVVENDPSQTLAAANLVKLQLHAGKKQEAAATLRRLEVIDPEVRSRGWF